MKKEKILDGVKKEIVYRVGGEVYHNARVANLKYVSYKLYDIFNLDDDRGNKPIPIEDLADYLIENDLVEVFLKGGK